MKMISMELPDGQGKASEMPEEMESPRYPWGLQLHLENEQLKALGIESLPKVGESLTIVAKVKVTRCGEEEMEGEEVRRNMALQVTEMGLETGQMTDRFNARYPNTTED